MAAAADARTEDIAVGFTAAVAGTATVRGASFLLVAVEAAGAFVDAAGTIAGLAVALAVNGAFAGVAAAVDAGLPIVALVIGAFATGGAAEGAGLSAEDAFSRSLPLGG
jgi:hypothetical protein